MIKISMVLVLAALGMIVACGSLQAETGLGRHKKLYAVPVPGKVVIDGKLNDWDLSGQIEMFVMSETKEMNFPDRRCSSPPPENARSSAYRV